MTTVTAVKILLVPVISCFPLLQILVRFSWIICYHNGVDWLLVDADRQTKRRVTTGTYVPMLTELGLLLSLSRFPDSPEVVGSGQAGPLHRTLVFNRGSESASQWFCQWPELPAYLSHLIRDYQPEGTLRSADKLLLSVPRMALSLSAKAFSVSAPSVWNSLSHNCRSAELFSTFKRNLKTELFDTAYSDCEHSA